MTKIMLTISGRGKTWQIEPNAKGTIIGRGRLCDVVIDGRDISREHARIFQDPFGRWIAEDLGSTNGIFVNGKRVETCAVMPGEPVAIGSFSLSITQPLTQRIERDNSVQTTATITIDGFETEVISGKSEPYKTLSLPCLERLNEITKHLSELTSLYALYPEVCRSLAQAPETVAVVLRLPEKTKPLPKSPDVLACHFDGSPDDTTTQDTADFSVPCLAFRLSRHVLEAVCSTGDAVMVKSIYSSDVEITWSAVDEHSPRAIICAPFGDVTEAADFLYLDIPIDQTGPDTLEFVRAVSREVVLTRKSLILMQIKAERSTLDHQLSLAQKIQSRLAPTIPQDLSGVDLAVYYKPTIWVGGDYCDVWLLKDGRLAFAVGDVSGEGLPAAMIMSDLRAVLRTTMTFCTELSTAAEHINRHLCQNLYDDMSVTLFFGLLDTSKNELEYVNAGHVLPLIMRPSGRAQPLGEAANQPLGMLEGPVETAVETIHPDTTLLVVTDGITKASSPDGNLFEMGCLAKLMTDSEVHSAQNLVQSVTESVADFRQTLAQQAIKAGLTVWIFDIEDEYSRLMPLFPDEQLVALEPEQLKFNFFQPPGDWIKPASWMDELGLLLRGATFLRDGSLNLFRTGLTKMFERKGITNGQTDWPSIQPIP